MCLTVLERTNKRIAKSDILVYKCLDFDGHEYCTPYQYMPIYFKNGIKKLEVKHFTYNNNNGYKIVEEGIHAYYDKTKAVITAKDFNENDGTEVHYAIIPKDAKYYIGSKCDIVSSEMIIFETEEDYYRYVEDKNGEKICKIGEKLLSLQKI